MSSIIIVLDFLGCSVKYPFLDPVTQKEGSENCSVYNSASVGSKREALIGQTEVSLAN
jgi:hypothetical protein